eukprot:1565882-Pyramimonas_sp.AAC.1
MVAAGLRRRRVSRPLSLLSLSAARDGTSVGLHAAIKPLFGHSATGEFASPPKSSFGGGCMGGWWIDGLCVLTNKRI